MYVQNSRFMVCTSMAYAFYTYMDEIQYCKYHVCRYIYTHDTCNTGIMYRTCICPANVDSNGAR